MKLRKFHAGVGRLVVLVSLVLACAVPQSRLYSSQPAKPAGPGAARGPTVPVPPAQPGARLPPPPSPADKPAFDRHVQEGWDSPFGVDYIFPLDVKYRDPEITRQFIEVTAARWVNFSDISWKDIEKRRPMGGKHFYEWGDLDEAVKQWQRGGVHIMSGLRFRSSWAMAPISTKNFVYQKGLFKMLSKMNTDYLPKPQFMQDLRAFVAAIVERYDGDGVNDMPGLLLPILHYQIGNEYYNEVYWAGTEDEYHLLLKEAYTAAHAANPNVKILLSGTRLERVPGFYETEPDARSQVYIQANLPKVQAPLRAFAGRGVEFSRKIMTFCESYDIFDARWSYYGCVARWREMLAQAGCGDKPIWSAEIYSYYPLQDPVMIPIDSIAADPAPSRSEEYRKILPNPKKKEFPEINAWYRRMQAVQVVRLSMAGLSAGAKMLMMGWAADFQSPLAISSMSYQGLFSATFKKFWPAAYSYRLLIDKLDGFKSCTRLPAATNLYLYECTVRGGRKVLVAVYDDHIGQNHDEPLGSIKAEIPFSGGEARITHIITEIDQTSPRVETVKATGGRISFELSEYPVFIEPAVASATSG